MPEPQPQRIEPKNAPTKQYVLKATGWAQPDPLVPGQLRSHTERHKGEVLDLDSATAERLLALDVVVPLADATPEEKAGKGTVKPFEVASTVPFDVGPTPTQLVGPEGAPPGATAL